MQYGKAAWGMQHGHAHTLLKTLAFPPAQWVSTLELGLHFAVLCGKERKKRKEARAPTVGNSLPRTVFRE